ncbi:MAG: hypothetical protein U1C74_03145 [Phenylobacterium sp.]|nr:hypothetical protein [Phenylobacterium sp.]
MTFRDSHSHPPKTLAEGAACFACALAGLAGVAVVLQWLMGFVG